MFSQAKSVLTIILYRTGTLSYPGAGKTKCIYCPSSERGAASVASHTCAVTILRGRGCDKRLNNFFLNLTNCFQQRVRAGRASACLRHHFLQMQGRGCVSMNRPSAPAAMAAFAIVADQLRVSPVTPDAWFGCCRLCVQSMITGTQLAHPWDVAVDLPPGPGKKVVARSVSITFRFQLCIFFHPNFMDGPLRN